MMHMLLDTLPHAQTKLFVMSLPKTRISFLPQQMESYHKLKNYSTRISSRLLETNHHPHSFAQPFKKVINSHTACEFHLFL